VVGDVEDELIVFFDEEAVAGFTEDGAGFGEIEIGHVIVLFGG